MREQLVFNVDSATLKSIDALMPKLGVTDRAKVIQKALALAKIATDNAAEGDIVTITGANGSSIDVALSK